MCSSKSKTLQGSSGAVETMVSHINGRPVLQPACNRVSLLERRNPAKKPSQKASPPALQPLSSPRPANGTVSSGKTLKASLVTPPVSPKLKSQRPAPVKRCNDPNGLSSSGEKVSTPRNNAAKGAAAAPVKKSKKCGPVAASNSIDTSSALKFSSSWIVDAPGSIAAMRREQAAIMQVQRKMKIAHYGRVKSGKFEDKVVLLDSSSATISTVPEEKRCSFITSNSDPIFVAYHDEEWGVPTHDDRLLFELLVLSGAQVGSDWTSVLKKRQQFREAFSEFDAETVSKFTEKKITSISTDYAIELSQVRGVIDNANRILDIKKQFGSFDKYLWGFVNNKPIATQYKSCQKIPVKTSKSEAMSKDMVRRGLRFVGPTAMHSFMQAAGLTNGHLVTCPRHQNLSQTSSTKTIYPLHS